MNINIEKLKGSKIEISVEIDSIEFEKDVKKLIKQKTKLTTLAGFRKGKAPEHIIIQSLGEMNILNDAAENTINKNYLKILKDNKIKVIGSPEINIVKIARKNPLFFKILVSVFPQIILPNYIDNNLPEIKTISEHRVDEREVEQALDYIKKSRAKLFDKEKSSSAEDGDFVEIEYNEIVDSKDNNKQADRFIIKNDEEYPHPFKQEVLGMKQFEIKDVKIKLPIEKKEKNFKLKLKSLKKVELPKLNDEFIKSISNFETLEDFKKNIREGLKSEKKTAEKQRVCFEFLTKISEKIKLEIPETLIEAEQKKMFNDLKKNIEKEISFDEYLKKTAKTIVEIEKNLNIQAQFKVKSFLILKQVAENQKIKSTEIELNVKIKETIQYYGLKEEDVDKEQIKNYANEQIVTQKTFNYIYSLYFPEETVPNLQTSP